ncbi:MAG: hypothetical protein CMP30_14440, partial [Roseibacillus sp.]|nr:hypothetical protein [Roseibacillus sp.]
SFGTDLVAGRNRVPNPAAGMTAFVTGIGQEWKIRSPGGRLLGILESCMNKEARRKCEGRGCPPAESL